MAFFFAKATASGIKGRHRGLKANTQGPTLGVVEKKVLPL